MCYAGHYDICAKAMLGSFLFPFVLWKVQLVEQVLFSLSEYTCSSLVFCGVRVTQSLVFCVVFWRSFVTLSMCPLSVRHCAFL